MVCSGLVGNARTWKPLRLLASRELIHRGKRVCWLGKEKGGRKETEGDSQPGKSVEKDFSELAPLCMFHLFKTHFDWRYLNNSFENSSAESKAHLLNTRCLISATQRLITCWISLKHHLRSLKEPLLLFLLYTRARRGPEKPSDLPKAT